MRLGHRVHVDWSPNRNDPGWEDRVEREAERTTNDAERAYRKAEARLRQAEERLAKAQAEPSIKSSRKRALVDLVEQRRQELLTLHRLMVKSPAGSQNRGKGSYRGVPDTHPL